MNIVLFNRDLRICDHQPLTEAGKKGEFLPLYVFEPSIWNETDLSARHLQFVLESLEELSVQIQARGGMLYFAIGEMQDVFEELLKFYDAITVFAYEESVSNRGFLQWLDEQAQQIYLYSSILQPVSENKFKSQWSEYSTKPVFEPPVRINGPTEVPEIAFTELKRLQSFSVKGSKIRFGQQGGELKASETLDSFLEGRFLNYVKNHQKPISSSLSSSRLSAYIAWGNISVRTVVQRTNERLKACRNEEDSHPLELFLSNLYLHDKISYLQKEESGTKLSYIKEEWNEDMFERWLSGKTGIPLVDAAMRSLHKTGWLNITLREVTVSFICNTLLMDCTKPSKALGELFLDYEPAIHNYYMLKLTGESAKRTKIINPVKMGKQLDADGAFIRRYVPELNEIPEEFVHEPWLYPGFYSLGYEAPMVDVLKANKQAKMRFASMDSTPTKERPKKIDGGSEQLFFDF